jgi:hypothetical protein
VQNNAVKFSEKKRKEKRKKEKDITASMKNTAMRKG